MSYLAGDASTAPGMTVSIASERHADHYLCAAAPELLAALQLLHDNLAEYQIINKIGGYDNHDMVMARTAIAKALGK